MILFFNILFFCYYNFCINSPIFRHQTDSYFLEYSIFEFFG
ncbi:hypothetical protein LEP1GSC150_2308 [Leptospira interrogans serovar Copenhageni str. LT2050]|uniref:Uncharacterized protein n=1 Tax=Leptospira interrogans serovar Copenhageni str. LT2050 TaxID=1001598 RepID=M3II26_LEPIT|nr:hypothetical protein LEP1GSC150_2308 [Leptospira interrogans serovar Copenhageni str. LT2050]